MPQGSIEAAEMVGEGSETSQWYQCHNFKTASRHGWMNKVTGPQLWSRERGAQVEATFLSANFEACTLLCLWVKITCDSNLVLLVRAEIPQNSCAA